MRLDYSLRLASMVTFAGRSWSPARLFAQGASGALFSARRGLFLDDAGTQPATVPGQPVALMRDLSGNGNHAVQSSPSQRPVLARHPARGIVNVYPANTSDMVNGSGWLSFRLGRTAAGTTATGEPAAILTASENNPNGAAMMGTARSLAPGTYTLSAVAKSTGWLMLRPTVEANFADGAQAWFNLGAGTLGPVSLGNMASVFTAPVATITPAGDGQRISLTFTITAAANVTMRFYIVDGPTSLQVSTGSSARLEAPQLEAGAQASTYQRRLSRYDITEAGQRSLWYLFVDGVDDWMQLAQPFTGGGAYLMAAVRDWHTGWPGPVTFGSISGASSFNMAHGLNLAANGTSNRVEFPAVTGWPALSSGQNRVDIVRVSSASQAQAWRNNTPYPGNADILGNPLQISGMNTLFRSGTGYGLGRFYGGIMVGGFVGDADRLRLHRDLAKLGGLAP